ncbi:MAG: TetR/AcrR family transcriptional regulator [Spirochaetaceae bacterium]|nr:TetR/AcrR family transcriptional regulator [Spirochaetaceae bacterium]
MPQKPYHHGDLKNALIKAGIDILATDGIDGLSLRKTAQKAGVSHAAPYAHFADKQALVAAIASAGHRRINARFTELRDRHPDDPLRQLVETAWAYAEFGLEETEHFRVTYSSMVTKERDYPDLVDMIGQNAEILRSLMERCQAAGILIAGDPELVAVGVWGLVHGFISLVLEGQISHNVTNRYATREMLIACLSLVTRSPISEFNITER